MNPAPLPIGKQFLEDMEIICADDGKRCKGTHPIICQDHGCAILAQREAVVGAAEKLRQNACGTAAATTCLHAVIARLEELQQESLA